MNLATATSKVNTDLRRTMPTFEGVIIDPRLVPKPYRASYLAQWGQWMRQHPNDWEPWMKDLVVQVKREKTKNE